MKGVGKPSGRGTVISVIHDNLRQSATLNNPLSSGYLFKKDIIANQMVLRCS